VDDVYISTVVCVGGEDLLHLLGVPRGHLNAGSVLPVIVEDERRVPLNAPTSVILRSRTRLRSGAGSSHSP
jgi:hypothetical protein